MGKVVNTRPLVAILTALPLVGCAGGGEREYAGEAGRADDRPFEARADVTADTFFAAGQFHETSIVRPANQQLTSAEQERQQRAASDEAVRQYAKALELDPEHAPSLFRTAALHTRRGDHDAAEGYWTRYAEATGGAAGAWVNVGVAREVAGRPAEAEAAYRRALAADPTDGTARANLGMLLARDGRVQEASSQLSSAGLSPAAVHWHLAHALNDRDPAAAARHRRAAAGLDPAYRQATASAD